MTRPITESHDTPFFLDSPGVNRIVSIIGRLGIAYLFCSAAVFHMTFGRGMTLAGMKARGVPFAELLEPVAMVISGGLALALLFNFRPRWAALGLALYTVVVSSVMYTPGAKLPPEAGIFFMKDMAIAGALLAWSCTLSTQERLAALTGTGRRGTSFPEASTVGDDG